jgi:hypothetical protein
MSENIKCTCGREFTKDQMVDHIDDTLLNRDPAHWTRADTHRELCARKESYFTDQELARYQEYCRHTDDRSLEALIEWEASPVRAELREIALEEAEIRELDV